MGFVARYPGLCAECGEGIKGHPVHQEGDDLVHDECPETQLDKDAKATACPVCWLIHPEGACDG